MAAQYQSEIRESVVRDLLDKIKKQSVGSYLRRIKLNKVRAFENQSVDLDFPVTALIGTNGGGKSTILGAAAIAHKSVKPGLFFPKSSIGDQSMSNWGIGYEIIEKKKNPTQPISRNARFRNSKWVRDDLIDRPVLYFGIQRTVPASERREFKKFATFSYKFKGVRTELSGTTQEQVARILGKDVSKFEQAAVSTTQSFYVGGDGNITYSEFHFGAGESSILRMVSEIEAAPENAIVLIEEIENGLHPVATRRMVEYLIDVASRRSIQTIFTTHSEDALTPLPPEAIWSSIDGRTRQGKISIEALRAITGRVDERLAIFVEDDFAKEWVEAIVRFKLPQNMEEIGVYPVSGDSQAFAIHTSHRNNPAIADRLKSLCVLDGDSEKIEDGAAGVLKLPGRVPEAVVFDYVRNNIDSLSMRLAVSMHLPPDKEGTVRKVVEDVSNTNRDPHLLFSQIGLRSGLVPTKIVSSAFLSLWIDGNPVDSQRIADAIVEVLTS
ncbi:putative ATPase [Brevundimonas bullata]|uniref:Putative ATPase n=1 Tax=Brevundimonas bullata TaxID=13160 RepID=A0A7W7IP85_9CAUL|nr:AAA family ATPase [Brevundimonas bullata]MBB4797981.1 putative ATPase [Brevundimonas bullata]MBB6382940.1 putative ATPase [Brevundimonas bullata]